MTRSIAEIESKIKELLIKEADACDIDNDLRVCYLSGAEEALRWVIGAKEGLGE